MQEPQRRHRPIEFVVEEIAAEAKVARERTMQSRAEPRARVVVGKQRFTEARHARPRVKRAEGRSGQQFRIVGGKLEADVEGLFHVRSASGIKRLVEEPGIASVAANCLDRKLPLVGDGQREEVARLGEGFGDQLWVDTMVDDVEEAHVAARRANLSDDPGQRGAIRLARRSKIDDGQHVH